MRIKSFLPFSLFAFVQIAIADVSYSKNDALTIHPILSIAIFGIHTSYEGALGMSRWAYEVPAYFGYNERLSQNPTLFMGTGIGIRRYVLEAGQGAYIEPELECVNMHQFASGIDSKRNIVFMIPSLRMGYKLRWQTVVLDLGLGTGFINGTLTDGVLSKNDGWTRALIPTGNVAIGIPF